MVVRLLGLRLRREVVEGLLETTDWLCPVAALARAWCAVVHIRVWVYCAKYRKNQNAVRSA